MSQHDCDSSVAPLAHGMNPQNEKGHALAHTGDSSAPDQETVQDVISLVIETGSELLEVLREETTALKARNRADLELIYPKKSATAARYELAMSRLSKCDLTPEILSPFATRLKEIAQNLDGAIARNVIALQAALNAGFRLMDMFYRAAVDHKPIGAGYDAAGAIAARRARGPAPALSINDTI